jgi:RHS repeat superfamily protein
MRKVIPLLFSIINPFTFTWGQISQLNENKSIIHLPTPATAEAYSFNKVGKLPMDLYRGKANINIPIYTIEVDGIKIPITLSYNTGGIRLNEISSSVGLGWSLSIPNTITKNVMGIDDDYAPIFFKDYEKSFRYTNQNIEYGSNDPRIEEIANIYEGRVDTFPDIFNYYLPTISGSFILNNEKGYTIPNQDIIIERVDENNFSILDNIGNKFLLSSKGAVHYNIPDHIGLLKPITSQNLYQIDNIFTTSGNKITFYYNKEQAYKEEGFYESAFIMLDKKDPQYDTSSSPEYDQEPYENHYAEELISKITFPNGNIYFEYSDDIGMGVTNGEKYRKDLNGKNVALKRIYVTNSFGKIIKDYRLNHEYFISEYPKEYRDYRLKLINVYDQLDKNYYRFSYDERHPLPGRGTMSDDYWGYINSRSGYRINSGYTNSRNIPNEIFSDNLGSTLIYKKGRNRHVNPALIQLGTLNSIQYPTGATRKLFYENNRVETEQYKTIIETKGYLRIKNDYRYQDESYEKIDTIFSVPKNAYENLSNPKFRVTFGNACDNNNDDISEIRPTMCFGDIITSQYQHFESNGKPFIADISASSNPLTVSLAREGKCFCSISLDILYEEESEYNRIIDIGGLRVKRIEDYNINNQLIDKTEYNYNVFNKKKNKQISSGVINQPFQFSKTVYKEFIKNYDGNIIYDIPKVNEYGYFRFLQLSNSTFAHSAYSSSDIVTYSQVIENNGQGDIIYTFTQSTNNKKVYTNIFQNYNTWTGGLNLATYYKKGNDTLKSITNTYRFNPLKNKLSGYNNRINEDIAFAVDLDITKKKILKGRISDIGAYIDVYKINANYLSIKSGKIEIPKTAVREFFNGKTLETVTYNDYYNTNMNTPINIKNTTTTYLDGHMEKTSYQYAHEKGNNYLIDKNIVGIPLETTVTQDGKIISKKETIYPTSQAEANTKTQGLPMPISSLGYDLENPSKTNQNITYTQYDNKGNLLEYKLNGITPVVIIWGYHQTLPIAKIEGATYDQVKNLVSDIISKSNEDKDEVSEKDLITALDNFRNKEELKNFQITTYTHNPLIGVTSITPPSGIREIYKYDDANRLKQVLDIHGNILKEYRYNYRQP